MLSNRPSFTVAMTPHAVVQGRDALHRADGLARPRGTVLRRAPDLAQQPDAAEGGGCGRTQYQKIPP
jgi:hypothetical protein